MGKKNKSLIGIIMIVSLVLITGTLALPSYLNGTGVSRAASYAKGRMHDDYQKTGNKDVYAENYGTEDLIVRVRLSEYFEQNGNPLVSGTKKNDVKTWSAYRLPATVAPTNAYRNFATWTLGGTKVYVPTFNTNADSEAVDVAGDGIDQATYLTNTHVGTGAQTGFTVNQTVRNPNLSSDTRQAKATLTQARAPISMATWKGYSATAKKGNYWVIDTDGWSYWANPLKPNTATSLLLTQVTMNTTNLAAIDRWYYGIDVHGQFATLDDAKDFAANGGITTDGKTLVDGLAKSIADLLPGEIFKFNNEDYIYVKAMGGGNHMIFRKEVLPTMAKTSYLYNGGDLDLAMKAYYNNLSVGAKAMVQPVQKTFNVTAGSDLTRVVTSGGERKAFAMSGEDLDSASGPGKAFEYDSRGNPKWGTNEYYALRSSVRQSNRDMVVIVEDADSNELFIDLTSEPYNIRPALIIKE